VIFFIIISFFLKNPSFASFSQKLEPKESYKNIIALKTLLW